jgi:serine O-acetyltransferase
MLNSSHDSRTLPVQPSVQSAQPAMSLADLRYAWYADLYRYEGGASARLFVKHLLLSPGFTFSFYLRLCQFLYGKQPRLLMLPIYWIFRFVLRHYTYKFGINIPFDTRIGVGLYIGHPGNIHFNARSIVGRNCNISQGVTLGQANRGKHKGYPQIGDGVYIGPGAKIVGAVQVGNNVAIGANCVVTKDVPDNAVVVGVPGRVISWEGARDYVEYIDYQPGRAGNNRRAVD